MKTKYVISLGRYLLVVLIATDPTLTYLIHLYPAIFMKIS